MNFTSFLLIISFINASSTLEVSYSKNITLDDTKPPSPHNQTLSNVQTSCIKRPLSRKLWEDLQLDTYLETYAGGKTLSVVAFANQQNMTKFACGIGRFCDAGELCSSANAPGWYILVAVQNWNDLMNTLYKAIAFSIGTVHALAPAMVTDLCPPLSAFPIKIATMINILAASISVVPGFLLPGNGIWYYLVLQGGLYTSFSAIGFYCGIFRPPPDAVSGYTKWTHYAWLLSLLQDRAQELVANSTLETLQHGISTNNGIYGVLKNGQFLQPGFKSSLVALERTLEDIIRMRLLSAILRSQNIYITRGSDPCNKLGPNGAFPGPEILSYCDRDGVMMNIVQAKGSSTVMKFFGSSLITEKHQFSVEFLTESAWKCQTKYKQFEYDPYQNGAIPTDLNSDCLFNLPVCDCTLAAVKRARRKGMRTTKACHLAGVPVYKRQETTPDKNSGT